MITEFNDIKYGFAIVVDRIEEESFRDSTDINKLELIIIVKGSAFPSGITEAPETTIRDKPFKTTNVKLQLLIVILPPTMSL
jgi:hypothetical protein